MVLKEFSLNVAGKGRASVSFYLHFDAHSASVGEIKIHTDFDSTLPHRAWLRQEDGQWKLFDEHPSMEQQEVVVRPEYLDDDLSHAIVAKILAMRAEEMG